MNFELQCEANNKSILSTHEIMLKILCLLTKRSWLNVFHSNKQAVKPDGILKLDIFREELFVW